MACVYYIHMLIDVDICSATPCQLAPCELDSV